MDQSHRDLAFDEIECSGHLWCLHCERTYEREKWRNKDGLQMCPYLDCDGDAVIDAWDWATIREHHREYPEFPEFGTRYPMYG